jgi:drug/metabolite transporter (DMT)-like permease
MDNRPKAIAYMICASLFFALMGATVKLSGDLPVFEKVFIRNLVSLFIAYAAIRKTNARLFGKRENQKYLILRSLLGLTGVVLYFYAINNMYLADSSMLNKLSPFFTTLCAWIFLKEESSKVQVPALIIVFIASLLIIKPNFSFEMLPALSGFISAIAAGSAYVVVRFLKGKEDPSTIVFYFSFVSVVGMLPLLALDFKIPTPTQLFYLIGTGITAAFYQLLVTTAYKYAPASKVSLYDYLSIVFSSILGFIIWSEIPDALTVIGGILIVITGFIMYVYDNKTLNKDEI